MLDSESDVNELFLLSPLPSYSTKGAREISRSIKPSEELSLLFEIFFFLPSGPLSEL